MSVKLIDINLIGDKMGTDTINIDLKPREVIRKKLASLRGDGMIPAVIHNHGKESMHVMGDASVMIKTFSAAGKHHPVHINLSGKKHLALIKDVDFEPTKRNMRHIVFQAINQNETVEAEVPVIFTPDADIPAEKASLMVLKQLDHVIVKALPNDLPNELVVDPSVLVEVGDSLSVADLVAPSGVTIMTEPETQIAVVEMPKDQIAEADAAAEAQALEDGAGESEEPATTEESTTAKTSESKDSSEEE